MFHKTIVASLSILFAACSMCKSYPAEQPYSPPISVAAEEITTLPVPPTFSYCPSDMVEINGSYCPHTDELCLYWVTIDGQKTNIMTDRCGEFRRPVHCLTTPIKKHFCIDKFEIPNEEGSIPQDWMSFYDAKKFCEARGKRLGTKSEWVTAASGDEYHPYPFGDGFTRDHSCNIDQHIHGVNVMKVTDPDELGAIALHNKLVPSGSMPRCISTHGVMDLSGNIDEFVINESGKPYISSMVGGHWAGVRNRSTPSTDAHGPQFKWYESGGRCFRDIIR